MMKWIKRRKKLVIIVVLAVVLSFVGFSLLAHSETDYLTVSQMMSQADSLQGRYLRVEGTVAPGSIKWDDKTKTLSFVLTDDQRKLPVTHSGIVPDEFRPGAQVLVEGRYRSDFVFESRSFGSRRSLCKLCHG